MRSVLFRTRFARSAVVVTLAAVIGVGAIPGAPAAHASELGRVTSATYVISISAWQNASSNLKYYASKIRATASAKTRQAAVTTALADLESIRKQFRGTAATALQRDISYIYSYSRQGLWSTTAAKLDQVAGKLDAVINAYIRGEDAMAKYVARS